MKTYKELNQNTIWHNGVFLASAVCAIVSFSGAMPLWGLLIPVIIIADSVTWFYYKKKDKG